MKKIVFIIIVFILNSCENRTLKYNKVKDIIINNVSTQTSSLFNYITINNENHIIFLQNTDSSTNFLIYKENGQFFKSFKLPFKVEVDEICDKITNDTLYVLYNNSEIVAYNIKNNSLRKYEIIGTIYPPEVDYHLLTLKAFPFIQVNDSSFLALIIRHINQSTEEGRRSFGKYNQLGMLIKRQDTFYVKNLEIKNPYLFVEKSNSLLVKYCFDGKNIIYEMDNSSWIYKYDLGNKICDSFNIPSNYIRDSDFALFKFDHKKSDYYGQAIKFYYEHPYFSKIVYNPYKKFYYRVNYHRTPYVLPNGRRNNYRNWSVSVLDDKLNLIGEIPFLKDSLLIITIITPSSKGFIVMYQLTQEDIRLNRTRLCEYEVSF